MNRQAPTLGIALRLFLSACLDGWASHLIYWAMKLHYEGSIAQSMYDSTYFEVAKRAYLKETKA